MNRNCIVLIVASLTLIFSQTATADSALTSTPFWIAYADDPMVAQAHEQGFVTCDIATFLVDSSHPIDRRLAVCNALGWEIGGRENHKLLLAMWGVDPTPTWKVTPERLESLPAEQMLCVAYLMALDDYFKPQRALPLVRAAAERMGYTFESCLILALVEEQAGDGRDEVENYRNFLSKADGKARALSPLALDIVNHYMDPKDGKDEKMLELLGW